RSCIPAAAPVICWEWLNKPRSLPRPRRGRRAGRRKLTPSETTMFRSVRARLTLWYAGVLTCTLLLLSLVIYWIVKGRVMARTDAGLVELADSFLSTLNAELDDTTPSNDVAAAARQSMLEHQYPGHSFALVASDGRVLASSEDLPVAARETRHN